MTESKHLDCISVEDSHITVVIIKKQSYTESDRDAVNIAIRLLKEE